jgi:hypothetical protein
LQSSKQSASVIAEVSDDLLSLSLLFSWLFLSRCLIDYLRPHFSSGE